MKSNEMLNNVSKSETTLRPLGSQSGELKATDSDKPSKKSKRTEDERKAVEFLDQMLTYGSKDDLKAAEAKEDQQLDKTKEIEKKSHQKEPNYHQQLVRKLTQHAVLHNKLSQQEVRKLGQSIQIIKLNQLGDNSEEEQTEKLDLKIDDQNAVDEDKPDENKQKESKESKKPPVVQNSKVTTSEESAESSSEDKEEFDSEDLSSREQSMYRADM